MAIYRQIHVDFWQDEIVTELSPEEKYFYLYLMTNNRTTQCGVYRFNLKVMAFDLGYDKSTVEKLLSRFVSNGRIKYNEEENEIYLVNWLKYNSARSPKVAKVIDKQLADVRTVEFKDDVISRCIQYGYPIGTVSKKEKYPIDTVSQPEPEPEQTKEPEPTQQKEVEHDAVVVALQFYEKNISFMMSSFEREQIEQDVEEFGSDMMIHAMKIAIKSGKRTYRYIEGILKKWRLEGVKTMDQVESKERQSSTGKKNEVEQISPEEMEELERRREEKRKGRGLL